jgi:hypothetical protein
MEENPLRKFSSEFSMTITCALGIDDHIGLTPAGVPHWDEIRICNENVVTNDLNMLALRCGHFCEGRPIVFV